MNILIGLGNPGRNYSNTKHNFGFWIIDRYSEIRSLKFQAGKGNYHYAKQNDLCLMKPATFMNNSGIAVSEFCSFFKAIPEELLVIYDDIDLPLGTLRFRSGGGTGGHKGVESIIYQLGSENFNRLRIGIATDDKMRPSEKYVLSPFSSQNDKNKNKVIDNACKGIDYFIDNGIKETMNQYNEKIKKKGLIE